MQTRARPAAAAAPRRHGVSRPGGAEGLPAGARRALAWRARHPRHRYERQNDQLTHDRAGVCRCGTQLFCQPLGREPHLRHHGGVCHAQYADRAAEVPVRRHRVRRGGVQNGAQVSQAGGHRGHERVPRSARPLRRDHAHAQQHPRGHPPHAGEHTVHQCRLFAHRVHPGAGAEPGRALWRERAAWRRRPDGDL